MSYRIMATQETGEETCLIDKIQNQDHAYEMAMDLEEDYPEWSLFVETERDYYAEAAARYQDGTEDLY